MTTDNYSLLKLYERYGCTGRSRYRSTKIEKVLISWYEGEFGESTAVNKLVNLNVIKKAERVEIKELVLW